MDELKPCPFCGGKAKVGEFRFISESDKKLYINTVVSCTYCHAEIKAPKEALLYAVKKWNKRTYEGIENAYPSVVGLLAVCKRDLAKIKDIAKGFMVMLHSGAENKAKAFEHIASISEYALDQFPLAEYWIAKEQMDKESEGEDE